MVDAGDTGWRSARIREADLAQQRIKAELQLQAFALAGIDAWTPGEGDLSLGLDAVQAAVAAHGIPALAANLVCDGTRPFPASRVVERGGVTLGFVGLVDPDVLGEDGVSGCTATDPVAALRDAAAELSLAVDALVVLHHGEGGEEEALATAVPGVGLVVNGHDSISRPQASALPAGAVSLPGGTRGKMLGLAEVTFAEGAGPGSFSGGGDGSRVREQVSRYEKRLATAQEALARAEDDRTRERAERQVAFYTERLGALKEELAAVEVAAAQEGAAHEVSFSQVQLGGKVEDHGPTAALVAAALERIAAAEQATADAPEVPVEKTASVPFVGSQACVGCHPAEHAQWSQTAHATAWQSLVDDNRQLDRACYSCHATGALHPEGPPSPLAVGAHLQGVGCESCHGPGREHVASQAAADIVRDPPQATCVQCHDGEQDEGRFDWDSYRPKVVHTAAAPAAPEGG